ncbi:MAG: hypothetical protein HYZ22_18590 [Chloroflexi bacterium]|nr:hypothetical protein [Chloroflexota bacterium]
MQITVAVLLLIVALILFWAWQTHKISNDMLNAVAAILTVVAGIAAILLFVIPGASSPNPINEKPLAPPESAAVQDTSEAASIYYDDFNNSQYDGNINIDLWERIQDQNCDVIQEGGTAFFRLNELSPEPTLCYLHMPTRAEYSEVGSVESRLLTESEANGNYSIGIIEFKTNGFTTDTIWVAQCGIIQSPKENKIELFFYVNNSYPNGDPEIYKTIIANPDQWYKMRLMLDAYTGSVWCFENDRVLGSHAPTGIDILDSQLFSLHILGFWSADSSASFKADDVIVKP